MNCPASLDVSKLFNVYLHSEVPASNSVAALDLFSTATLNVIFLL
jgi:hypothetical protein